MEKLNNFTTPYPEFLNYDSVEFGICTLRIKDGLLNPLPNTFVKHNPNIRHFPDANKLANSLANKMGKPVCICAVYYQSFIWGLFRRIIAMKVYCIGVPEFII